ncbi:MAG TPA: DinB family protein [Terriglobia bacterium]|jgi:hypothetical protein|nr:DinB family protein [Terriglobia bacterium]
MAQSEIERLLALIDEAYAGPAWHGPSLRFALRGVTPEQAAWRAASGRHNIWELTVHAAYWKYAVRRRLLGGKRGGFAEAGNNWFERGDAGAGTIVTADAKTWRRDLAQLARAHRELRQTVAGLRPSQLDRPAAGSRQTPRHMIAGTALHDVYHAGQIQLLKRLVQDVQSA